ncbi:MAG: 2-C-methyl-D-erythritol 4-phosphate cytidylyltransferase [Candidatus Saganbacteria bacterium]|nr:2-C-methyl-D-erythritol 4-phosphate cytidylyltransferase [Candidatus Saganbacteria bacterium]
MRTAAIITAGGSGKRMGRPKQFLDITGQPMLWRTAAVFEACGIINEIIVVVNQEDVEKVKAFGLKKIKAVVAGGLKRQDSVANGLRAVAQDMDLVAIHDGARPFIEQEIIERAVKEAAVHGAVVVGVPVVDTIKMTNDECRMSNGGAIINKTVDRSRLWAAQTPQVFKKDIILRAYSAGSSNDVTDDAMLVEKMGVKVKMVMGSYNNIKITSPADLKLARAILAKGEE